MVKKHSDFFICRELPEAALSDFREQGYHMYGPILTVFPEVAAHEAELCGHAICPRDCDSRCLSP